MPAFFDFEVTTPFRRFFSGKVEAIVLTLSDGEIGVYADHSPFTAPSQSGMLRIKDDKGEWRSAFVSDGILEVKDQSRFRNALIVEDARWPDEINREEVLAAKKQAEEDIRTANLKFQIDSAKEKLRSAELMLKVADNK